MAEEYNFAVEAYRALIKGSTKDVLIAFGITDDPVTEWLRISRTTVNYIVQGHYVTNRETRCGFGFFSTIMLRLDGQENFLCQSVCLTDGANQDGTFRIVDTIRCLMGL